MFWLRNKTANYLVHKHNKSPGTCHFKFIFTYRFVQNQFIISLYDIFVFEHFDIVHHPPLPPVTNHAIFIWCVKCKITTVSKRISLVTGVGGVGGSTSVKPFLFSMC